MDDYGEHTWEGITELVLEDHRGRMTPDDPDRFRAVLKWMRVGSVRIELFEAGPHSFERRPDDVERMPFRTITTLAVGHGRLEGHVDGRDLQLERGDVAVFDSGYPIGYACETPIRTLRSVVEADVVPDYLLSTDPLPASVLPRTRLVNGYIAFVSALMSERSLEAEGDRTAPQLVQALVALQLAVIAESRGTGAQIGGLQGLRARMESHVLSHLDDPGLDPGAVATAVGVSVRYAHQVFNRDGLTLAAFIRERRLDAVATELRDPHTAERLTDIGTRHGFGSRDQLARAFRRRFGTTMSEYRRSTGVVIE